MTMTRRTVFGLTASALALGPALSRAESRPGTLADALDLGYRSGLLDGLHAIRVQQGGAVALERYFTGHDEIWGRPTGPVEFSPGALHDLRSVSKSIVGLLYGIALERGLVPPPDAPLIASFPEHADLATDPGRARLRVHHALNMTMGTDWNESLPYTDPRNSEIQMENAPDRLRFILSRDVIAEPGAGWSYNGGATALIGALIERGSGMELPDFARAALFDPLGVGATEWIRGRDGAASAASGLRMTAPDLARIGAAIGADGTWHGRQILPRTWLDQLRQPQAQTAFGTAYSHFWYLSRQFSAFRGVAVPMIHAAGNGGQRLYVLPQADLVVVVFAGAYNRPDDWMTPTLLLQRLILTHL